MACCELTHVYGHGLCDLCGLRVCKCGMPRRVKFIQVAHTNTVGYNVSTVAVGDDGNVYRFDYYAKDWVRLGTPPKQENT